MLDKQPNNDFETLLDGKRVLIIGGTGSLGQTLLRRIMNEHAGKPERIVLFSRDEAKQYQIRAQFQNRNAATHDVIYQDIGRRLEFRVGDARDLHAVCAALRDIDIVIYAAAMKQVPTCEYFPFEAVMTNVVGAENVIRAAREFGRDIETVVGISTDKAVKPVNVMGMTKALQERVFARASLDLPNARFVVVRYGNVLASRGSAIPLFLEQIREGGPVTITHREMTRFLLSLKQAVDVIFHALQHAKTGETVVPRLRGARVVDIAKALIGDRDIEMEMTGIRPGEKLHEVLISEEECFRTAQRGDYFVIESILPDLRHAGPQDRFLQREYHSGEDLMDLESIKGLLTDAELTVDAVQHGGITRVAAVKIVTVLGTRPEIIRLSRIIPKLDECVEHILVNTGQNFDPSLSTQFFTELEVRKPDYELGATGQSFGQQIGRILEGCEAVFVKESPNRLLILGDTNSALCSIVAKRLGIEIFHMEAGNRCYDDRVPEEVNRRLIDHASDVLMPYTVRSRANLLREGIDGERIFVTGNPILEVIDHAQAKIDASRALDSLELTPSEYMLVTLHRAENVDIEVRLRSFTEALRLLAERYGRPIVVSTHPRTAARMKQFGIGTASEHVRFLEPFGFFDFIHLEKNAACVLSDSGTVQEECAIFGVPNVTLRDVTERPETIECGSNILSGAEPQSILACVDLVLRRSANWIAPPEYLVPNVSDTVLRIVTGFSLRRRISE